MKDLFEDGKNYYADGEWKEALDCFVEVTDMTLTATNSSRDYRGGEMRLLRRDVKELKQDVKELREGQEEILRVVSKLLPMHRRSA